MTKLRFYTRSLNDYWAVCEELEDGAERICRTFLTMQSALKDCAERNAAWNLRQSAKGR